FAGIRDEHAALLSAPGNLRSLDLHDNSIGDAVLEYVGGHCPRLQEFSCFQAKVTEEGLVHLGRLTSLESVRIHASWYNWHERGGFITDRGLAHLGRLAKLRCLHLKDTRLTDEGLARLANFPNLEELVLEGNVRLSDGCIDHLLRLRNLRKLDLRGTQVTAAGIARLKGLPRLEDVAFAHYTKRWFWRLMVTDDDLPYLLDIRGREKLDFTRTRVSGRGLAKLNWIDEVTELRLADNHLLTGDDLAVLEAAASLVKLEIGSNELTDDCFKWLRYVPNLQDLSVKGYRIKGTGIGQLKGLPRLTHLGLHSYSYTRALTREGLQNLALLLHLRNLDLSHNWALSDDVLAAVVELPALESLNLHRCEAITDRGLKLLHDMPSLTRVTLTGCRRTTEAGREELLRIVSERAKERERPVNDAHPEAEVAEAPTPTRPESVVLPEAPPAPPEPRPLTEPRSFSSRHPFEVHVIYPDGRDRAVGTTEGGNIVDIPRCRTWYVRYSPKKSNYVLLLRLLDELRERKIPGLFLRRARLTDEGLAAFKDLPDLAMLWLRHKSGLTAKGLAHLAHLPNLRFMDLYGLDADEEALAQIGRIRSLEELELGSWKKLTDAGLAKLRNLANLRRLELGSCRKLTGVGFRHLRHLPRLSRLALGYTGLTDEGLAEVCRLPALTHLDINGNGGVKARGLASLGKATKLRELDLSYISISDESLEPLSGLPSLSGLRLRRSTRLTDAGLAHLAKLKNLTELDFYGCTGITDRGMAHLRSLGKLTKLDITKSQVTDKGVEHIRQLAGLVHLDLHGTRVTDAGVARLAVLKELEFFNLAGTPVTDACLVSLRKFPDLTRTYLGGTELSEEAKAKVHEMLKLNREIKEAAEPRPPREVPEPDQEEVF
ncbi:MAG: hypothetical protein ACYSU0_11760, partial [Planctomycetota bacterium]